MSRAIPWLLLSLLVASSSLVGCSGPEGPLKALSQGSKASYRPPHVAPNGHWTESYGDLIVCNAQPVTITDVTVTKKVPPTSLEIYVHPLPADEHGKDINIGSAHGKPGDKRWPWHEIAGRFIPLGPSGVPIQGTCDGKSGQTSIVVSMGVGPKGAMVKDPVIAYTSGGESFTAQATYTFVACGQAFANTHWCRGDPSL